MLYDIFDVAEALQAEFGLTEKKALTAAHKYTQAAAREFGIPLYDTTVDLPRHGVYAAISLYVRDNEPA